MSLLTSTRPRDSDFEQKIYDTQPNSSDFDPNQSNFEISNDNGHSHLDESLIIAEDNSYNCTSPEKSEALSTLTLNHEILPIRDLGASDDEFEHLLSRHVKQEDFLLGFADGIVDDVAVEQRKTLVAKKKIVEAVSTPKKHSRASKSTTRFTDSILQELKSPLIQYGWSREIIYRSDGVSSDVYYRSPSGRKLRSIPDIQRYLQQVGELNLTTKNFSFAKVALECPTETIRNAKVMAGRPSVRTKHNYTLPSNSKSPSSVTPKKSKSVVITNMFSKSLSLPKQLKVKMVPESKKFFETGDLSPSMHSQPSLKLRTQKLQMTYERKSGSKLSLSSNKIQKESSSSFKFSPTLKRKSTDVNIKTVVHLNHGQEKRKVYTAIRSGTPVGCLGKKAKKTTSLTCLTTDEKVSSSPIKSHEAIARKRPQDFSSAASIRPVVKKKFRSEKAILEAALLKQLRHGKIQDHVKANECSVESSVSTETSLDINNRVEDDGHVIDDLTSELIRHVCEQVKTPHLDDETHSFPFRIFESPIPSNTTVDIPLPSPLTFAATEGSSACTLNSETGCTIAHSDAKLNCSSNSCSTAFGEAICAECLLKFQFQIADRNGDRITGKENVPSFICSYCFMAWKAKNNIKQSDKPVRAYIATQFDELNKKYQLLKMVFKHLNAADLLKIRLVCKTWNDIAMLNEFWRHAYLQGAHITNWSLAASFFSEHNVKTLDFASVKTTLKAFSGSLKEMDFLYGVHFGQVLPVTLNEFTKCSTLLSRLESLRITLTQQGLSKRSDCTRRPIEVDFDFLGRSTNLTRLQFSSGRLHFIKPINMPCLQNLCQITDLTLLDVETDNVADWEILKDMSNLQVLQVGSCLSWTMKTFGLLTNLKHLEKLRLECGDTVPQDSLTHALAVLPKLVKLHLIRFTISRGLMDLVASRRFQQFIVWPDFTARSFKLSWCNLVDGLVKYKRETGSNARKSLDHPTKYTSFVLGLLPSFKRINKLREDNSSALTSRVPLFDIVTDHECHAPLRAKYWSNPASALSQRFAVFEKDELRALHVDEFIRYARRFVGYSCYIIGRDENLASSRQCGF